MEQETTAPVTTTAPATVIETAIQSAPVVDASTQSITPDKAFELFKNSLSEDVKSHSYISKYKTADDFAKAGINHQSALTKKASDYFSSTEPDVVAERNKVLGVPEKADDYDAGEYGQKVSEESLKAFKSKAHEMGLPAKYLPELVKFEAELWEKHHANVAAQTEESKNNAIKELQSEWKGETFSHNVKQVMNLMTELGLSEQDMLVPIGNNTALIKALHSKIVPLFGSDKLIEGTMSQSGVSADEQMRQFNVEMMNNQQGTPEYRAAMDGKRKLMARMS